MSNTNSAAGGNDSRVAARDSPPQGLFKNRIDSVPVEIQQISLRNGAHDASKSLKHSDKLTIQVPKRADKKEKWAAYDFESANGNSDSERMEIDSSLSDNSSSMPKYEKITHLPTPVLRNSGSFGDFPSPPMDKYEFDIPKRTGVGSANFGGFKSRVVSDYRPSTIGEEVKQSHQTSAFRKRIVSTPVSQEVEGNTKESSEKSVVDHLGQIVHSPRGNKKYKVVKFMGSGTFSTVSLAVNICDNEDQVVIKFVSLPNGPQSKVSNFKHFIKRELNILYSVNHPCIVRLLDFHTSFHIPQEEIESRDLDDEFESDSELKSLAQSSSFSSKNEQMVFLEYCPGGNLYEFSFQRYNMHSHSISYWRIIERIICELISALVYLHDNQIIHRDIKLENVLLNYSFEQLEDIVNEDKVFEKPLINLTDFGLSKRLKSSDQDLVTRCGSQDYIAPEVLIGLKYNGKITDVWSMGVLIYALLENRLPFDVPPLIDSFSSNISPSVLKRRRLKNNTSHRIAMIDWDWFVVRNLLMDGSIDDSVKHIISRLKKIVDTVLVRKDMRPNLHQLLGKDDFSWVYDQIPRQFIP